MSINADKYNERLQRARSGKMSKPESTKNIEFDDLESGTSPVAMSSTRESLNVSAETPVYISTNPDTANIRYVDRRGPCNRFERGLCSLGNRLGVKVVFEG